MGAGGSDGDDELAALAAAGVASPLQRCSSSSSRRRCRAFFLLHALLAASLAVYFAESLRAGTVLAAHSSFFSRGGDEKLRGVFHRAVDFWDDVIARRNEFSQQVKWRLQGVPEWFPVWSIAKPSGVLDPRLPSVEALERDARKLLPWLETLKSHKFFRIFKIDLNQECPFWARKEMCTSPGACHVCQCDEAHVPIKWREQPVRNFVDRETFGTVRPWGADTDEGPYGIDGRGHSLDQQRPDLADYFEWDSRPLRLERPTASASLFLSPFGFATISDEDSATATYVDLSLNRPGYTAYAGRNIWQLIYKENCMGHSSNPFESLHPDRRFCTEEEMFFRIVSGMQTVIMTLSAEYNRPRLDPLVHMSVIEGLKREQRWLDAESFRAMHRPDVALFKNRVAPVRQWIENLYVDFGVLLQTLCKLQPILSQVDCDTGDAGDDEAAQGDLRALLQVPLESCQSRYVAGPLFERKQELAMRQFANISRIMDCLDCEKCRLHGKVKIVALQLALRSSGPTQVKALERNELIALVNALDYFADGIAVVGRFRRRLLILRLQWLAGVAMVALAGMYITKKMKKKEKLE